MKPKTHRRHCPEVRLWRAAFAPKPGEPAQSGVARCNFPRRVVHHSPDGIEWGYGGSGPADLALLILTYCLPPGCDGLPPEACFKGNCSRIAWQLHQGFKHSVIGAVGHEGGTIAGPLVDTWIDGALAELVKQGYFDDPEGPCLPRYRTEVALED